MVDDGGEAFFQIGQAIAEVDGVFDEDDVDGVSLGLDLHTREFEDTVEVFFLDRSDGKAGAFLADEHF